LIEFNSVTYLRYHSLSNWRRPFLIFNACSMSLSQIHPDWIGLQYETINLCD
jgi:hypothetical protein